MRHVVKLHDRGSSKLQISTATGLSRTTVRKHLTIFTELKTPWEALSVLSDKELHESFRVEPVIEMETRLKLAKADGSYLKELVKMEKQNLLVIDDFGMQPPDAQSRAILMEIIEDRHGKRSTLFTSQVPVAKWYEVIGEQTIADAVLDRITVDAHKLELLKL